jgi:hypothetical protein
VGGVLELLVSLFFLHEKINITTANPASAVLVFKNCIVFPLVYYRNANFPEIVVIIDNSRKKDVKEAKNYARREEFENVGI